MKTSILFFALLITSISATAQTLNVPPQNSSVEGGEIKLENSNSSYNPWHIDNYAGHYRLFHSGTTYFQVTPTGETRVPNDFILQSALKVSKETNFDSEGSLSESIWGNYILTNNSTSRTLRIGVSNDNYTRGEIEIENNNSASANIFFKTSNSNGGASTKMSINGAGHVGIGTTTPSALLEVKRAGTIGGTWNPSGSFFTLKDSGSGSLIMDSNEIYSSSTLYMGSASGDIVKFRTVGTSASDKVVIKNNGRIGVGTTNPTSLLDVRTSDNKGLWLNFNNESAVTFWPNNGNSVFHLSHGHDNKLHISQGGTVGAGKLMTFVNNGNVGIGTTAPDSKLTVAGNIHAREVKVTIDAGADFVFAKDYKLPSLQTLEAFVKTNKHLPEIASEKEMQENGLLLAEMNIKLLQKIEELTLYTIDQEKRIESLEEKNEKLIALVEKLLNNTIEKQN